MIYCKHNITVLCISTEDNDTVAADLSTSDIFSEEMEDLASESSGSHCDEITFVQASDTSVSGNEVCIFREQ